MTTPRAWSVSTNCTSKLHFVIHIYVSMNRLQFWVLGKLHQSWERILSTVFLWVWLALLSFWYSGNKKYICNLQYTLKIIKTNISWLSPRLPWWILTYRSKYANIPKNCGNELILHSTYRFWNLLFIVESDDFIWKNSSFWFQICFCLKYFIIFYYANRIFKISP